MNREAANSYIVIRDRRGSGESVPNHVFSKEGRLHRKARSESKREGKKKETMQGRVAPPIKRNRRTRGKEAERAGERNVCLRSKGGRINAVHTRDNKCGNRGKEESFKRGDSGVAFEQSAARKRVADEISRNSLDR